MPCCGFLDKYIARGNVSEQDRKHAKFFVLFFGSTVLASMPIRLFFMSTMNSALLSWIMGAAMFVQAVGVLYALCGGNVRKIAPVVLGFSGMTVLMCDLVARGRKEWVWPVFVLLVDYMLVLRVPEKFTVVVVGCLMAWLVVLGVEEGVRFGLLDIPGTTSQGGENGRREHFESLLRCEQTPCATGLLAGIRKLLIPVTVFIVDFIATRGFARAVIAEQKTMERTISTVQQIALLLAGYDVDGVARMLDAQQSLLPVEMHATLHTLEQNLRKYRPYLPAALFEEMETEMERDRDRVQHTTVAPPGLDSETATIVFTDIRASTSIWENAPEGMHDGLKIHNRVIREVMEMYSGYEVKTIGDAFMIAFSSTCDGVSFGLRVQERLFEADWPASLLADAPICASQGSLWRGLTVRIGVNTGPVTVEHNTLTGRTDYFGHTVNIASRLESTCTPGAVALPCDIWESGWCDAVVGDSEALDLKGVSGKTSVCCIWPVSLAGRRRTPLCERAGVWNMTTRSSEGGSTVTGGSSDGLLAASQSVRQMQGTVGIAELAVGNQHQVTALHSMSTALSILTIALDQSKGSLVTLLGNCVCVAWNVTRAAPAHMENAVRFAKRLRTKSALNGAGLVSGPVLHGDVGARTQRFVTVMGQSVRRSWTLCEEAVRDGVVCVCELPEGVTPPSALENVLVRHKHGYVVKESLAKDNL